MDKNLVLISSAILFKEDKGKKYWFLVKNDKEGGWEFPRTVVRKVESSVRASIRMMGEQGGMTVRVIEEAGRSGGVTSVNNKIVPQRHIYYFMILLSESGEAIGFSNFQWVEDSKVLRTLVSKREQQMLKNSRAELKTWSKRDEEEEVDFDFDVIAS